MSNKNQKIFIVIPTYKRAKEVIDNITSIENSTYTNVEIVVVDDGSPDDTPDVIRKTKNTVTVLENKKNMGAAYSRNKGIEHCINNGAEYILLLDSDVEIAKTAIEVAYKVLSTDSNAGAVTFKILYYDEPNTIQFGKVSINLKTGLNISEGEQLDDQIDEIPKIVMLAGGNMLLKRAVIDSVGLFDNVYRIYYEDADYSMRINATGMKILYLPHARIFHKYPKLSKRASTERWLGNAYLVARNKIIFMFKYSTNFRLFCLFYPVYITFYTLICIKYFKFKALKNFYIGIIDGFSYAYKTSNKA